MQIKKYLCLCGVVRCNADNCTSRACLYYEVVGVNAVHHPDRNLDIFPVKYPIAILTCDAIMIR